MKTKTSDPKLALAKLLRAWRKRFVDITFEYMAASTKEREQLAGEIRHLARRHRLEKVGFANLRVNDSPVIAMLTYHCGSTPGGLVKMVMDDAGKIMRKHPGVEFHFRFLTKV